MLTERMKELVKRYELNKKVRVNRAGCLDACAYGPSMVVYPEAVWYGRVELPEVDEIFQDHILNGRPVKRLMIDFAIPGEVWKVE